MAASQAVIVRAFNFGKGSTVLTIPKRYSVERGTPFLVDVDQEGRITYTPVRLPETEKAKN